jgi:hypothetical protein
MPDQPVLMPGALALAAAAALTMALALLLTPARALAQVSPGPLARAHETLDQPTQCFQCHAREGGMTQRCLDCHIVIAGARRSGTGFHGREARARDCAGCHPDHAGRDFALVRWDEGSLQRFDHRRTGYTLTGKHATLACADCHQAKFQRPAPVAAGAAREPAHRWSGLGTTCTSCHADPHKARFGASCVKCHGTQDWKRIEARRFDHDLTRYPLRGKHAKVRCESCHDPASPTEKDPPFERCGACHKDAHAGQALVAGKAADCAACHTVEGFKPSTFTVEMHQREAYRLEGRHATVACVSCHPKRAPGPAATALGTAAMVMRPPHERCMSCHVDAHGGQLAARADRGACESCHRLAGWKPSTFTVADHAALKLRLEGAHAPLECAACHALGRPGLPPPGNAASLGTGKFAFKIAELECAQCHQDPHLGRFATGGPRAKSAGCLACHDVARWRPATVTVASHRDYGFALEQAHGAVACTGCHAEMDGRPKASSLRLAAHPAPLPFEKNRHECIDCHADIHGKQFATRRDQGACEGCHELEAWRPAARFVHDRDTRFKLEGAHAKVACAACHPSKKDAASRARVVYHGVPVRCESCHAPADRMNGGAR